MPYIKLEDRRKYDDDIKSLILELKENGCKPGHLNYIISMIVENTRQESYDSYNEAMGVLSSAAHELYRRTVIPYEDKKILENTDIQRSI